jgi:hypothetical protein
MVIRYESLVADPVETLTSALTFIGEEMQPDMLERAFRKGRKSPGLGDWKIFGTNTISDASIARWEALPGDTVAHLAVIVNPVLERCGYTPVDPPRKRSKEQAMRKYELTMMLKSARANDKSRA